MLAVVKIGGKQYLVSEGDKLKVEKLKTKEGEKVTFEDVLLLQEKDKIKVGNPRVEGAKVTAEVISHGKEKKVIVFRYKSKTRHRVKKGHRQPYSEIKIVSITA